MQPTYYEFLIMIERAEMTTDIQIEFIHIETEAAALDAISGKIKNTFKILSGFIDQIQTIIDLYVSRSDMKRTMSMINKYYADNPNSRLKKETIQVRGYNGKIADFSTLNNTVKSLKALLETEKTKCYDNELYEIYKGYTEKACNWDNVYTTTPENILRMYNMTMDNINDEINELKSSLFDLSRYVSSNDTVNFQLTKILTYIKNKLATQCKIILYNMDYARYQLLSILKRDMDQLSTENVKGVGNIDDSIYVKDITYGHTTFHIYKRPNNHESALIYKSKDETDDCAAIYVENTFFNLPKAYQQAILYHEIGHYVSGHLNSITDRKNIKEVEDLKPVYKQMRKDIDQFRHKIKIHGIELKPKYEYDYIIYLCKELDADRFAKNEVGRRVLKKSLNRSLQDQISSADISLLNDETKYVNKILLDARTSLI